MQIVKLPPAIVDAAKIILKAEQGWQDISRKAQNSQETRLKLEAQLFHSPSPESLAELVHFDSQQKTIGDLQQRIVAGQLNHRRLIGARVKSLLAGPLAEAVAGLEADLAASIQEDSDLALEHGMSASAGPRTRSIAERLTVAQNTLAQVIDGGGNPTKVFARLGYPLNDSIDAEAMSQSALKAVRATERILAATV